MIPKERKGTGEREAKREHEKWEKRFFIRVVWMERVSHICRNMETPANRLIHQLTNHKYIMTRQEKIK